MTPLVELCRAAGIFAGGFILGRGYSFDVIRFKLLFAHSHQKKAGTTMRSRLNNMGVPFSTFDESFDVDE